MNRRFWVTAAALAALVALAGCGSAKPGSVPSSTAPSTSVTVSASAPAATSPPVSAPPRVQAAGPIDVQDVSFVSADQGWALGSGELATTTDGGASWTRRPDLWITRNGGTSWSRVTV
jgi:predicted small lipoprotein YifL